MSNKFKIVSNGRVNASSAPHPSEQLLIAPGPKPFNITQSSAVSNRYDVYLSEPIVDVFEYVDLFSLLRNATPNDVIYIHLNCPGGSVDTGMQIIAHMKDSAAHVVTATYGTTASMGSAIFLSGDEFMVSRHSRIMVHNYSGAVGGKGHEIASSAESVAKYVTDAFRDIFIPFIDEDEFKRVLKGEDLWLHDEDVVARLERMIKERTKLQIAAQIESNLDTIDALADANEELYEELLRLEEEDEEDVDDEADEQ